MKKVGVNRYDGLQLSCAKSGIIIRGYLRADPPPATFDEAQAKHLLSTRGLLRYEPDNGILGNGTRSLVSQGRDLC